MALFGSLEIVCAQTRNWPGFAAAFAYLDDVLRKDSPAHKALFALSVGTTQRHELAGGIVAMPQVYEARERYGIFESHRRYHDIQVIVSGVELIEVADIECLNLTHDYDAEKDFALYGDYAKASVLRLGAGDAAVFAPRDGHMPSIRCANAGEASALVRKIVLKVPVV